MYKLLKKSMSRKETLRPGTYLARVTQVQTPAGYVDGSAFEIHYMLETLDGKEIQSFSEIFWNVADNPRTQALSDLMDSYDIQWVEDLVAKTIKVTILRNVSSRGNLLTITHREPWLSADKSSDSGEGAC